MRGLRGWLVATLLMCLMPAYAINPAASFDLQRANVAEVLQLIYREALSTPYVLDPEVLTDSRSVSFRYKNGQGDLAAFMSAFLASLGYEIEKKDGVDFVRKRREEAAVQPSPPALIPHVYSPRYRDVSYLARVLSPLFNGSFSVNRKVRAQGDSVPEHVSPGSAAAMLDQDADVLLFAGVQDEVDKLLLLLPQVDTPVGEVLVRGVLYEVSNADKSGSAFGLLANLLGGKLNIGIGAATSNFGSFVQIKNSTLDAVFSMLETDSRFKLISSPSLRIRSGSRGVFSVGQEVPVLGALSFPQGAGQAVQSVEYRNSGVIFDIRPTVRDSVIDLTVNQQLSDFIKTTTGVNNSPTLTKRELKTTVGLQDGDVIVLGGLAESKENDGHDGLFFLPKFLHTASHEKSIADIVLVLQVDILKSATQVIAR